MVFAKFKLPEPLAVPHVVPAGDPATTAHVQADLYFTAGLINGWHRARVERLSKKALRRWDKFKRLKPFWA